VESLKEAGAVVSFADPFVPSAKVAGKECKAVELSPEVLSRQDLVVVLVAHPGWSPDLITSLDVPVFDAVNLSGGRQGRSLVERL
jgi:UDP-N-acetyl-D-glucosamine dehydrogenase